MSAQDNTNPPEFSQDNLPRTCKRAPRDREHPYYMTPRKFIEDFTITLELKGFLLYCFSRPDGWEYQVHHLAKVHNMCYRKCLKLLHEGIESGYIERITLMNGNLKQGVQYLFYEEKIVSKNVSDMHDSCTSKEIFEKEEFQREKEENSNNFTDVSRFRHAEKVTLINNDNKVNKEHCISNKATRGREADRVEEKPCQDACHAFLTSKEKESFDEVKSWNLNTYDKLIVEWIRQHGIDKIRAAWDKARNAKCSNVGAYVAKLLREGFAYLSENAKKCLQIADAFGYETRWRGYGVDFEKLYCKYELNGQTEELSFQMNPEEFERTLRRKYAIAMGNA